MDQTKIGKLIAKLRKEKGLTQRELGDKVGVGFKAVSKWERGITCPDISIINDLSKILGITSDELLTGELSKEHIAIIQNHKKTNKKLLLIIPILLIIFTTFTIIFKNSHNQVDIYELASTNDEYYIEGKVIFNKNNMEIYINNLLFNNKKLQKEIIKNYEYTITTDNENIYSYGYISITQSLNSEMTISDFSNVFKVDQIITPKISKNKIVNNGLNLNITFLDINENLIEKSIAITLSAKKK